MLGRIADTVTRPPGEPRPRVPFDACYAVAILGGITLAAGAGTTDQADLYGPKDSYWWDLRRLACWGFTAGTVTVRLNDPNGSQVAVFTTPGEFTWSAARLLAPRDRLIFVATGITGTVQFDGTAIQVLANWLADYLM